MKQLSIGAMIHILEGRIEQSDCDGNCDEADVFKKCGGCKAAQVLNEVGAHLSIATCYQGSEDAFKRRNKRAKP